MKGTYLDALFLINKLLIIEKIKANFEQFEDQELLKKSQNLSIRVSHRLFNGPMEFVQEL